MKKSTMILLLNLSLMVFVSVVVLCVYLAPKFTYSLIFICLLSFLYILTEQWTTHAANEFENRFWTAIACMLAYTCVFTCDSPIKFPNDQPFLAWTTVLTFSYFAHLYDRHLKRVVLGKIPNIRRIASVEFPTEHRLNAKHKLTELRRLLHSIDLQWLSSTFQNIFLLPRVVYIEHQIIKIFREANADELNLIIMSIELALIVYKVTCLHDWS